MKSGLKINVYRQSKINKRETRKISGPRGEWNIFSESVLQIQFSTEKFRSNAKRLTKFDMPTVLILKRNKNRDETF